MIRALFFILLYRGVCGLKCWTCENARTNQECNRNGILKACEWDDMYCQHEIRVMDGGRRLINKQCKQSQACQNNKKQNVAGLNVMQCDKQDQQSVCRCCCNTDNCNKRAYQCGRVEKCETPPNPPNGRIICPRFVVFDSVCKLVCNPGFRPFRNLPLRCVSSSRDSRLGQFSYQSTAKCIPMNRRCEPIRSISHGRVVCTNPGRFAREEKKNFEGTVCNVACNKDAFLSGHSQLSCSKGHWNVSIPLCVRGKCPIAPKHGYTFSKCTMGRYFGSKCRYSCDYGFRRVGKGISTCRQSRDNPSRGYWVNGVPRCQRLTCPVQVDPLNGKVYCSNDNFEGSTCTFTCNAGFDMEGDSVEAIRSECKHKANGVGEWTASPPVCIPIICEPITKFVSHGHVVCSADNTWGSSCTFKCDAGYDLGKTIAKSARILCDRGKIGNGVGEWSGPRPVCSPVRCSVARRPPLNGFVTCTNHNYAGSVCTFRCKRGYDLGKTKRRTYRNKCIDQKFGVARGSWDFTPAFCRRRIHCKLVQQNPSNGRVECSNANFEGSSCRFQCDEGFVLVGKEYIHCVELLDDGNDEAEWTAPPSKCRPKHCPTPWYNTNLVRKTCRRFKMKSSRSLVGTRCRYSCRRDGYYAARDDSWVVKGGVVVSICTPTLVWNTTPPRCFIKTCVHLQTPQNGIEPVCTNGNKFGSRCKFRCKFGYKLTHRSPIVCINGKRGSSRGRWSTNPPYCARIPR